MSEKKILQNYLPEESVEIIFQWIQEKKVHLTITKSRSTKSGDYRPPVSFPNHRISVNHNLNKYAFLITLVHELAHLSVWEKHKKSIKPHGKEWKEEFRYLMNIIINTGSFPVDIEQVLQKSIQNSKASSNSDLTLTRILKKYDNTNGVLHLEDLDENELFAMENGKIFRKGTKRRTRYICLNVNEYRNYSVHALAPVKRVKIEKGYYTIADN